MAKFDADFAIFGVFAADVVEGISIADTQISYTNESCIELFGELKGKTILEVLSEISGSRDKGHELLDKCRSEGKLAFEGKLAGKIVKYHSRIIEYEADGIHPSMKCIQAGLTDITESFILKKLLYGTSKALKRAAKAADEDTGDHVERINHYSHLLASLNNCEKQFIEDISQFAQLHDIGKINFVKGGGKSELGIVEADSLKSNNGIGDFFAPVFSTSFYHPDRKSMKRNI